MSLDPRATEILDFWFGDTRIRHDDVDALAARTKMWFFKDLALDETIRARFGDDHEAAARGERETWTETPPGKLALVVLLDQFPRNLYRDSGRAFATDRAAFAIADEGIARGVDRELAPAERIVFYLPFMHSEDRALQARNLALFTTLRDEGPPALRPQLELALSAAVKHKEVVDRFGRFPHRNAVLGRAPTAEEEAFLAAGGSRF
jgi:uncharacterized protein (DUF924 family)